MSWIIDSSTCYQAIFHANNQMKIYKISSTKTFQSEVLELSELCNSCANINDAIDTLNILCGNIIDISSSNVELIFFNSIRDVFYNHLRNFQSKKENLFSDMIL
jgi:hypothetical protein